MDILFFMTACLGLAETIDLFCGKDFLIFLTDAIHPADYDLKKVFAVERWIFAVDTLALFGISWHVGGVDGDLILIGIVCITLIFHVYVFKSPKFKNPMRTDSGKKRKKKH